MQEGGDEKRATETEGDLGAGRASGLTELYAFGRAPLNSGHSVGACTPQLGAV